MDLPHRLVSILLVGALVLPTSGQHALAGQRQRREKRCAQNIAGLSRRLWLTGIGAGAGLISAGMYLGWPKPYTEVTLVGEEHSAPAAVRRRSSLMKQGYEGEIIYGSENWFYDAPQVPEGLGGNSATPHLYGLEHSLVHGAATIWLLKNSYSTFLTTQDIPSLVEVLKIFVLAAQHQKIALAHALDKIIADPSPFTGQIEFLQKHGVTPLQAKMLLVNLMAQIKSPEVFELLTKQQTDPSPGTDEALAERLGGLVAKDRRMLPFLHALIEEVGLSILDDLLTPENIRKFHPPTFVDNFLRNYPTPYLPETLRAIEQPLFKTQLLEFLIDWRNELMFEQMKPLIALGRRLGKRVYFVVGERHVPGLHLLIQKEYGFSALEE